jgi:hypothetical protein
MPESSAWPMPLTPCLGPFIPPGHEREEAVAELIRQKEKQFDPDLVDILIDCLEENQHEWKDFSFYF